MEVGTLPSHGDGCATCPAWPPGPTQVIGGQGKKREAWLYWLGFLGSFRPLRGQLCKSVAQLLRAGSPRLVDPVNASHGRGENSITGLVFQS